VSQRSVIAERAVLEAGEQLKPPIHQPDEEPSPARVRVEVRDQPPPLNCALLYALSAELIGDPSDESTRLWRAEDI
jgi:hypothetical protein